MTADRIFCAIATYRLTLAQVSQSIWSVPQ